MIEKIYQHFSQTCLISTDSRKIEKGCVFVALKGEKFDGNNESEEKENIPVIKNIIFIVFLLKQSQL